MGLSIKNWEKEIKKLSDAELKLRHDALDDLLKWKPFHEQYDWTGLGILRSLFKYEIENRELREGQHD